VLVRNGIDRNRITVIHSGISLEATRAVEPLGIRDRLGLTSDALIAANVAALVPHKDQATLLGAAKHLAPRHPTLHWVVAGEGELRGALEARINELGLRDRVHLMGQIDTPERLIAEADVFVMSSRHEGLGTSVLEAMALGTPIASTAAGGLPEMLGGGAGLMAAPGDSAGLGDAVARILEDRELRNNLVEVARTAVLRFTDQRMADQVRSVYRSFVHSLDGS
jgi:glycosyltransferase involved in cell wall biosynthesis